MDSARRWEIAHHRLPAAHLEALARGSGSPEITRYLFSETELSRRLRLVMMLFEHCREPGILGPLPPADEAWDVLDRSRAADRAAVDDLLLHPQVGAAVAHAIRRRRGGAPSDFPAWTDLGIVHVLALIAAARAGLTWSTELPTRYGTLMLPTLGLATFAPDVAASTVEARTEAGSIHLSGDDREITVEPDPGHDTEHWWHLRHLFVGTGLALTIWLDDLDPFRDVAGPVPPARLDDAAVERWEHLVDDAWALLCADHSDSAAALAEGVISLVPLPARPGDDIRSASNPEAFGSVMVSEPPDEVSLAVALVREFQRIKVGAIRDLLTRAADDRALYYAPWRDDPCALDGLLQGIYASFGVAEFWRRHRLTVSGEDALLASYEYLYARGQAIEALTSVRDAPTLTSFGRDLVLGLGAAMDPWLEDRVGPDIVRLADLTADCHRTAWRLRHRQVASAEAAALAYAWRRGRLPEVPSMPTVAPDPTRRRPPRIPMLAREHILGVPTPPSNDVAADLALVDGDPAAALPTYLDRIATSAPGSDDEIEAWAGAALALADNADAALALAAKATNAGNAGNGGAALGGNGGGAGNGTGNSGGAADALLRRPDLVRAVHAAASEMTGRAVDPLEIATWLAPVIKDS